MMVPPCDDGVPNTLPAPDGHALERTFGSGSMAKFDMQDGNLAVPDRDVRRAASCLPRGPR
jgi:hypothetical protein